MRLRWLLGGALAILALAVPVALSATPNAPQPGQRIDMKVLLISADGTEPGYGAWKAQLDREGVPYDTFVAYDGATKVKTLDDATLADYGAQRAKYQAVVLASGDLGRNLTNRNQTTSYLSSLTDPEWETLAKFERTFGIRRLSDFTAPNPEHGLQIAPGASKDGVMASLTEAGKAVFPYLKGPIPIANDDPANVNETFGYEAAPVNPADWQTLVAAPAPSTGAFLGIWTRPDGREEMVMTLASNQYQSHNQLLRHGMLTWVTRGVFLGFQRTYLGLDIDDIFLPDDKWDAAANVTDYRPESAIRMSPADVDTAVAWQRQTGLKMNMVYNMGGVAEFGEPNGDSDALLARFSANKNEFRWINHTLQHPNLDCTTRTYTQFQLVQNQSEFNRLLAPVSAGLNDPSETVTGEHSGLANVRPGNPGTIDPPTINELAAVTETGGALVPGATYDYAITAKSSPTGETVASVAQIQIPLLPDPGDLPYNAVQASFSAVCHAVTFNLYRKLSTETAWQLVGSLNRGARDPVDDGTAPYDLSITDTGGGTPATLPTSNTAALAPYAQNPDYVPALNGAGIRTVATDSSKGYPNPPNKTPLTATAGDDPTNFLKGATFPVSPTIQAVPRYPSNIYYNVANRADQLDEYNWIYVAPANGGNCVPITGVTTCRTTLATWDDYLTSETRIMFGHLMGNDPRPHYFHQTNIAQSVPNALDTDTSVGGIMYAAINTLLKRYDEGFDRASMPIVQLSQDQVAQTLVQQDTWAAKRAAGKLEAWIQDGRIHLRNNDTVEMKVPITGTTEGNPYGGHNSGWITVLPSPTPLILEPSNPAAIATVARPVDPPQPSEPRSDSGARVGPAAGTRGRVALRKVKMSPRRFAVAHRRLRRGTRLDGTLITWRLNKSATIRLRFQRAAGTKRNRRWVNVGTISRTAKAGRGVVRFRGRFRGKLMRPGAHRMVVVAIKKNQRSAPRRVTFKVVKP